MGQESVTNPEERPRGRLLVSYRDKVFHEIIGQLRLVVIARTLSRLGYRCSSMFFQAKFCVYYYTTSKKPRRMLFIILSEPKTCTWLLKRGDTTHDDPH